MNNVVDEFAKHCHKAAERFLRTAVVIDDQAYATPVANTPAAAARAQTTPLDPAPVSFTATDAPSDGQDSTAQSERDEVDNGHDLKTKDLIRAFTGKKIICSVYEPEIPTQGVDSQDVEKWINDVMHADLLIIDWQLEKGSSDLSKQIIKHVLQADQNAGGQLRHITVYTGETSLDQLSAELLDYLNNGTATGESLQLDLAKMGGNKIGLVADNLRILFKNKQGSTIVDGVRENDLPEELIQDFAMLTDGILPSLALHAIATVREAAHHSLALFSKNLDGAFIAHRCLIPDPEDAETFIEGVFSDHFRALLAGEDLGTNYANKEICDQWLEKTHDSGTGFTMGDGFKISMESVKERIGNSQKNADAVKQYFSGNVTNSDPEKKFKNLLKLPELFSDDAATAALSSNSFSRITSVELSATNAHRYNEDWCPLLTLGAILKKCSDTQGNNTGSLDAFLLCVQPRCDSVRLGDDISFPFLKIKKHKKNKANLVFQEGDDCHVLYAETKPSNLVMVEFSVPTDADRMFGKKSSSGEFVFEDKSGDKYQWIATLNPLKAQCIADSLGARTHSVGMDEFEWLRIKS